MNTNKIIIDKCRLCLTDGDNNDLTPIFTDNDDPGISLAARIMVCLSIPVEARDSLPCSVCKVCENRVTQFYEFREICYDSYYSLLGRRLSNEYHNFIDDTEKEEDRPEIKAQNLKNDANNSERAEESQLYSEQNVYEFDLGTNNQSAECDIPQETCLQENNGEEIENLQSNLVVNEITCKNVETDDLKSTYETDEKQTNEEKILSDEDANFDDEVNDIRYKCLRCDGIFPDFDSASIHCAECSTLDEDQVNATTVHTNSMDYPEDSFKEQAEDEATQEIPEQSVNCTPEESTPIIQRKSVLSYGDENVKTSRLKSSFARKRKIHDKNLRHSCADCDSVFSSAALLRRHSVVHTGERPYECSICKKRFSQVGQLNFHKNFHDNPRYRCEVCKKPFLRPSDIEKHMRTHTGEKPYGCSVCAKSFAQLVALQQHERIHTGDKPYVCEICGKKFSQKANKTKHVKIHKEGAKPHTCEICGRSFSDLEEMNLHRAGHGGGKPRKCNYCEESFRKMSELAQHIRRYHTFERPHKCAFCQKAFYSLYNLKQHVMVHTGQKPYACSQCDLKFTQKGNLTKHVERKHGEKCGVVVESEEEQRENVLIPADSLTDDTNVIYDCTQCSMKFNEKDKFQRHLDQHAYSNKCVILKNSNSEENNEQGMLILANGLSENTDDPVIIEREETVQVETGEINTNLQIYEINE